MQKIAAFIMSKKFIPVVITLTVIGLFFTFKSIGNSEREGDPREKNEKIIQNVGVLLEQGHYSPKKIDDAFSRQVIKKFTEELDNEKSIFLKSDIVAFKKFENSVDDEIHGKSIESFYFINDTYINRLNEVSDLYKTILSSPMDFSVDEKIQLDEKKYDFSNSVSERTELWRKRLKYAVLSRYSDMLEERTKNKDQKEFVFKSDTTLEREARDKVLKQMDRYFTNKKKQDNSEENFSVFINCITGLMDPHTNYFPPIDMRSFNESMSGRFYGIGAQLREDDGKIIITSLVSGGPAWKSGELKENDEIIKVGEGTLEPVDVTGYTVSDAVKLIRGSKKGTEVRLTIKRADGTVKVVSLIRDDIKLEDTFAKSAIIKGANKIGYIYLPEFYADFERAGGARCAVDVAKEVEKLKSENVDGIILDLRGNGGGSLYDVVQMAGLFIENGPVCQVKGKDEVAKVLEDKDGNKILYNGPLAVMVDGTSASASEIFAAAIQDYKRGIIIGSTSTYGKGTVQRNIPLNPDGEVSLVPGKKQEDLGSVKLTLQKFYRINGGATQLKGVTPDVVLPDRYDYLKFREKDNPDALKWDEIAKAKYDLWTGYSNDINKIIISANEDVKNNKVFQNIKSNVQILDKYTNREYSLSLSKYQAEQKQLKEIIEQMDTLVKLKNLLVFENNSADKAEINSSKDKIDKNQQWIKFRSNDIYIKESVNIMNRLISNQNLAQSDLKK